MSDRTTNLEDNIREAILPSSSVRLTFKKGP